MSQPKRLVKIIPQSYQSKKGHGVFNMQANYLSDKQHKLKPKNRKDWFYESIKRFSEDNKIKCLVYNHRTQSVWLYEKYIPSAIVDKENLDKDYKLKNGKATTRYRWHTMVVFD